MYGSRESRRPTSSQSDGDAVYQVGVHDVRARSAAHVVPGAVVLDDDPIGARTGVDDIATGAAVQEVGSGVPDQPIPPFAAEDRVGSHRPDEAIVRRRADHPGGLGRSGENQHDRERDGGPHRRRR